MGKTEEGAVEDIFIPSIAIQDIVERFRRCLAWLRSAHSPAGAGASNCGFACRTKKRLLLSHFAVEALLRPTLFGAASLPEPEPEQCGSRILEHLLEMLSQKYFQVFNLKKLVLLYCLCCVKPTQISEKQTNNRLD